jgi:GH24 family phage-related lysozyme (muramidase)
MIIDVAKMLTFEEGKRLKAYLCSQGYKTVGIGHNLDADPAMGILKRTVRLGTTITEKECAALFEHDLKGVYAKLSRALPEWTTFEKKYQYVLISMFFQLKNPMAFKNTINNMRLDRPEAVIAGIKSSLWYKQTPNRCDRLIQVIKGVAPKEYV